jgi:putative component of toxin-antitoxin plasmid stabilization module
VNSPIEIHLRTLHLGEARQVVTLGIDGKDFARDFLLELFKHDCNRFNAVQTRIQSISNHPHYENKQTFRHVGEGVFEFKRPGIRLYAFYDEIDDHRALILCTNGGLKGKDQSKDIRRAQTLKADYFRAKSQPDTILRLIDP